jgi:hypothetical protein
MTTNWMRVAGADDLGVHERQRGERDGGDGTRADGVQRSQSGAPTPHAAGDELRQSTEPEPVCRLTAQALSELAGRSCSPVSGLGVRRP